MSKVAEIFETLDYGPAPEAAGPALDWLDGHERRFGHFIDGAFTKPGKTFATLNPASSETLAEVTEGTADDVDRAVKAARAAFPAWSALSGYERAKYLYAIARQIQKESRLFSVLETLDNGKPIRETRDIDIPLVARHFYHHAGWAQHIQTSFPEHVPYGVCGQIIPWNFPLLMLSWKIAPALAAGNTVVLKPAEFTSLTALLFAEICARVGLPKGVVNIVTGAGETGEAIVNHSDIDKIAFTGSTEVGKIIRRATAGTGKGLSLELGGKSPFIVFEDADLDSAVEGLVDAIWFNQGQVCCAGSRLLIQESVEDKVIAKIKARMTTLRVGDPLDKSIDIGALVAPVQVERVLDLLKTGRMEGGDFYSPDTEIPGDGCYMRPTLVTGISPAHTLASEEIFGPVLVAMSFRTPEEAVALANNTRYGLAASVWTENINLALDIAPKIKAGVVWINSTNQFDAAVGFGGYRESGFGREGGREGMAAYLKPAWEKKLKIAPALKLPAPAEGHEGSGIDRTAKLYIGGKQARPDSAYARAVLDADGRHLGEVGEGNRKDIRNAVEAARGALGWAGATAHNRSQILYYLGENLDYRKAEFADRLRAMTGVPANAAKREVELSIERLFAFGGWADKFDGAVHNPPVRMMAVAMVEPVGVLGIAAPAVNPLLGSIALLAPAIAMGNTAVLIPSEPHPLAMTDFYQILETSDVPSGVVNIVTGPATGLAKVMAEHDGVDAIWFAGSREDSAEIERLSAGNVKQSWTTRGLAYDWADPAMEGTYLLERATQIKNVWVPYGA
ncbi:MAG TPA: aldehyde dehydrogenase family protein [Pelagibacterium sp.]|uniref:aldehyde dehydrogenase family protein n=1 Tax=Pelagibacterium sp. TaxID=1967288 RepID=UPI002CEE3095|nr:aldehyde dehydrogenase family protein [Pelagibacterium sp.]HWJ88799.1 aldehyde dehydrogenase family protein [Pelagibacterium sp.]